MHETLAQALATPALTHDVVCDLACAACGRATRCNVRGVAVGTELVVLGDLRCAGCDGADLGLRLPDARQVRLALHQLAEAGQGLPQASEAFLRDGVFLWRSRRYADPRALRADVEDRVTRAPGDALAQLEGAGGMVQVRDMVRALELARRAHELSPAAPEPALFVGEVGYALGNGTEAERFAREALARKDGPLLVFPDHARVTRAALRLLNAGQALRHAEVTASADRAAPCPCGSGQLAGRCCAVAN